MKELKSIMKDMLYEFHKQTHGQPSINTLQKMDKTATAMAKDLDAYIIAKTNVVIKEFQTRVVNAFDQVEVEISALKERNVHVGPAPRKSPYEPSRLPNIND